MKEVFFTSGQISARASDRPQTYLADLELCVTRRTDQGVWVNQSSPAWKALREKYATNKTLIAVPRDKWPLVARAAANLANPEDKGIGDTVARLVVGGETFKTWYERIVGSSCGCQDRQAKLNAMYPYN